MEKAAQEKWSKAVVMKKKKRPNKTKTLIEYSSILILHSGFNKEKNKPNQPHISGYEQQYNRHIIYEKWEIIISFTSLGSSSTYGGNGRKYGATVLNTSLCFFFFFFFFLTLNQSDFISTSTFIKDDPAWKIIQKSFFITSSSYIDQTFITLDQTFITSCIKNK